MPNLSNNRNWIMLAMMMLIAGIVSAGVILFNKAVPQFQLSFIAQSSFGETRLTLDCEHYHYSVHENFVDQRSSRESVQHLSSSICVEVYRLLQQVPKQLASVYNEQHRPQKMMLWTEGNKRFQWRWQNKYEPSLKPIFAHLDDLVQQIPASALAGGSHLDLRIY
ncbi:hypothetical protein [Agarivorans sp. Z349TD_8]|uniref:hypothetical protein n=1 Tax=Agarivorans sp. Z349TD_8 TaxID=3421434 RepID=UPI003D7D320A